MINSSYLDIFRSENWQNATAQQKMDAYQALENDMATQQGRPARQVVFSDMTDENNACGYYSTEDDKLHMNAKYITETNDPYNRYNQFDGMDTIIHEGRHAYQGDVNTGYIKPDERLAGRTDALYKNDARGIYCRSGAPYYLQTNENDAHNYAYDTMNGDYFSSHFQGDEGYSNYCAAQRIQLDNYESECQKMVGQNLNGYKSNFESAKANYNELAKNPNATNAQKEEALSNAKGAYNDYVNYYNNNYTDGHYDVEKSGDNLVNSRYEQRYSYAQSHQNRWEPSDAQKETYSHPYAQHQAVSEDAELNNMLGVQSQNVDSKGVSSDSIQSKQAPVGINQGDYRYQLDTVNPNDIDMSSSLGMDDPNFWNHHGNTKEDYMELASHLPDVQNELASGRSLDDLYNDPELGSCAYQYYSPSKMIGVNESENGGYEFSGDGRHRIEAAKELGYDIPVQDKSAPYEQEAPALAEGQGEQAPEYLDFDDEGEKAKAEVDEVDNGAQPTSLEDDDSISGEEKNALLDNEVDNSLTDNDSISYADQDVDDYYSETEKDYAYGSHNVYSDENDQDSHYAKQASDQDESQDIKDSEQIGEEPKHDESQDIKDPEQIGEEPKQDEGQDVKDSEQLGSQQNQNESPENNSGNENSEEAGAKPSQDESPENDSGKENGEEAGAKPSQDESPENNNGKENSEEAGAKPSQYEEPKQDSGQASGGQEPSHDSGVESPSQDTGVDAPSVDSGVSM